MSQVPSLNSLIESFDILGLNANETLQRIGGIQKQFNVSTAAQTDAIRRQGELAAQARLAADQITMSLAQANAEDQARFGTNPDAASYVLGELNRQYREGQQEVVESAATLQQKMQTGFSDDPIGWIVQQFTLPREVNAHNAKVAQVGVVEETITKLQQQTISAIAANAARTATTNTTLSALEADKLRVEAEINASKAEQEAAKVNLHVNTVQHSINQGQFQAAIGLNKAATEAEQLDISKRHLQMENERLGLARDREQRERAEEARKVETWEKLKANDAAMQAALDRATEAHGMVKITVEQFKTMTGPMRDELQRAMTDPDVQRGRLAATPSLAIAATEKLNSPLTAEQRVVKGALVDMAAKIIAADRLWTTRKPAEQQRILDEAIKIQTNLELKNIPNEGSIFSPPPLNVVGKIEGVARLPFWQLNFSKQAENEYVSTNAQQIFNAAVTTVMKGEMPLDQVAEQASTIFDAIAAENRHARNYGKFSLNLDTKYLNGYNTRIEIPGVSLLTSPQTVDLANKEAFKNHLMRAINRNRALEATVPGGLGVVPAPAQTPRMRVF